MLTLPRWDAFLVLFFAGVIYTKLSSTVAMTKSMLSLIRRFRGENNTKYQAARYGAGLVGAPDSTVKPLSQQNQKSLIL